MKSTKPCLRPGQRVTAGAAAFALAVLSTSIARADVVAGWDTWDSGATPTASVVAPGVTGTAVTATEQLNWHTTDERGASADGDWGTNLGPPLADTTVGTGNDQNLELPNATSGGTITFTITNNGAEDIDLGAFHFDAVAFRFRAARTYELSVLDGGAISAGIVYTSAEDEIPTVPSTSNITNLDHLDIDHDLTGLADSTLEVGGTVGFLLAFSGGDGGGQGGHDLWVDNVAVTSAAGTTNKLAITSVPASATAGADFSVTIEAQDSGGTAINVTGDTEVSLVSTGTGVLSGATGTIEAGTSSVTLTTVQSTVAETITLAALATGGDELLPSVASAPVDIVAGPAAQIVIETADDGTGEPIGDIFLLLGSDLNVFAIARDTAGNFVGLETAAEFSLVNITGEITPIDLDDFDSGDGMATFYADYEGTTNIQATVTGFSDATTGLITTVELTATWDRTGGNSSWNTAANWLGDVLPDFDEFTDIILYAPVADDEGKVNVYLGGDKTARSLTYNAEADANFNIRTTISGTTGAADLFLDTDSTVDPATINVDADAEGNFRIGNVSSAANEYGDVVLADNLLVIHNGSGTLRIDAGVSEIDGSFGITKAGTGTLVLSGTNTYTGTTTVDAGTLLINGDHSTATGAITVDSEATLGGTGTIGGTVTMGTGAILSPGILTMNGDLDISALAGGAGTLDFGLDALANPGDSIEVDGNVVIGSGLLGIGDVNITNLGALEAGTYTLISSNSGITGTLDSAASGNIAPGWNGELQIQASSIVLVVTADASGSGIVITDISKTGLNVTVTFTSSGDVDVYRSADLQTWGAAHATGIPAGAYTDTNADLDSYFYLLVPAGDPAP